MMSRVFARRQVLATLAALPLAACAGTGMAPARRRPLGLADLTVMKALRADYAGTLKQVAAFGYTHFGFRLAGYGTGDGELPPAEKARLVRDAGLEVGVVRYGYGKSFAQQVEEAASINASLIALSAAPVFFKGRALGETTRAAFDAWLPELGEMARTARSAGLTLLYHNHWWDHVPLDGETPLDLIARRYSADELGFEIDLAWTWLGGVDPLGLVRSLGSRVRSMHFKDVDPGRGADRMKQLVAPGSGKLDYQALVTRLDTITDAVGYVEVDGPEDGMADAEQAARLIRRARQEITA